MVAIKKIYWDKRYKNREVAIMKELYHPNIICFKNAFNALGEHPEEMYLNIVMECIPESITKMVKSY